MDGDSEVWSLMEQPEEVDDTIQALAEIVDEYHRDRQRKITISQKEKNRLAQEFRHAESSRGTASKAMTALAEAMDVFGAKEDAVEIGSMKSWERAVEKMQEPGRNMHDLGRGRILLKNPDRVKRFHELFKASDKEGNLPAFKTNKVRIIEGSLDDYLSKPRKSGYAGSINFDLEVDLGKGRVGKFEVQIMPRDYKQTYDHSHRIYEFIREIDKVHEKLRTPAQRKIHEILIKGNSCLFDEIATRSGFIKARQDQSIRKITDEEHEEALDVLDRFRIKIQNLPGKPLPWRQEAMDALTFTKSSLTNIWIKQSKADKDHKAGSASPEINGPA